MKVLTIDNKYDEGDQSHFFIEREGVWVGMFKPSLTLRQFLDGLLMRLDLVEDDEDGQFDVPEGGVVALVKAAAASDAAHFFNMLARWDKKEGMLTSFGDWEVGFEELGAHYFGTRELATILAALRFYQQVIMDQLPRSAFILDIATSCGEFKALNNDEIDDLCDKLN